MLGSASLFLSLLTASGALAQPAMKRSTSVLPESIAAQNGTFEIAVSQPSANGTLTNGTLALTIEDGILILPAANVSTTTVTASAQQVTVTEASTVLKTKTKTETVSVVPTTTSMPSLEEVINALDEVGVMGQILPTVYLTLVPTKEADGSWDYVVYQGADGTATASPTFVSATPTPTSQTATMNLGPVITASPSSSASSAGSDTVPPTLADADVISSLLPTATPSFSFTLPGVEGTVSIGATTTTASAAESAATTIASEIGHGGMGEDTEAIASAISLAAASTSSAAGEVASGAVASASASSAVVGVVSSPNGDDEEPTSASSAALSTPSSAPVVLSNGTIITANGTLVTSPIWTPPGNLTFPLTNSSSSSAVGPVQSSVLPSSAAHSGAAAFASASGSAFASASPSPSASASASRVIQLGSSSVVVVLPTSTGVTSASLIPLASASAISSSPSSSVAENDSGVETVTQSDITTVTQSSAVPASSASASGFVKRRRPHGKH